MKIIFTLILLFTGEIFGQNEYQFKELKVRLSENKIPTYEFPKILKFIKYKNPSDVIDNSEIKKLFFLSENILFLLYESNTGVSSTETIITINSKMKVVDIEELMTNLDSDGEGEHYYFESKHINDEKINPYIISVYEKSNIEGYESCKIYNLNKQNGNIESETVFKKKVYGKFTYLSVQPAKDYQLKKMSLSELRIARNTIFAIKGYNFKSSDLRQYFSKYEWYQPIKDNRLIKLNELEKINIEMIKSYEKTLANNQ